jgi:hypothetical protein
MTMLTAKITASGLCTSMRHGWYDTNWKTEVITEKPTPVSLYPPQTLHGFPIICYTEFFNAEISKVQHSSITGHYAAPAVSCSMACSPTLMWKQVQQTGRATRSLHSNASTRWFLHFMNEFQFKPYPFVAYIHATNVL